MKLICYHMTRPTFTYGSVLLSNLEPDAFAKQSFHSESSRGHIKNAENQPARYFGDRTNRSPPTHRIPTLRPRETIETGLIIKHIMLQVTVHNRRCSQDSHEEPPEGSFGTTLRSAMTSVDLQINLTSGHPELEPKTAWTTAIRENNPTATLVFTDGSELDSNGARVSVTDKG